MARHPCTNTYAGAPLALVVAIAQVSPLPLARSPLLQVQGYMDL